MFCNGQLECLFHMALTLSVDCTAHSPSDGPILGQWWWQETMCRDRWSPRGSIRFQLFPVDRCPMADQWTLAQLGLHPYIFNWRIGIYDTGSVQGFRKAETMMEESKCLIKRLAEIVFLLPEVGMGSFICTNSPVSSCHSSEEYPQSCWVLSQRGGCCLLLSLQNGISLLWPPCQPPKCILLPSGGCQGRVCHSLPWQKEVASSSIIEGELNILP